MAFPLRFCTVDDGVVVVVVAAAGGVVAVATFTNRHNVCRIKIKVIQHSFCLKNMETW